MGLFDKILGGVIGAGAHQVGHRGFCQHFCYCGAGLFRFSANLAGGDRTHGWLLPANAPTPENGCDQMPRPTGALLFVAGTNGALTESPDKSTILNIGNSTQLSVERDESRLAFDADIYNNTGNLSVRIVRNEFHLVSGEYSYQERSGDRSTITVYNKQGGEMLYVYYANATTVLIRGLFTSPDGTRISIDDKQITVLDVNNVIRKNCKLIFSGANAAFNLSRNSIEF